MTHGPESEKKLKKATRPFYKFWPVWVLLVIVVGWPYVNDWAWSSAKLEARSLIIQFETKLEAQTKAQAGSTGPAQPVAVDMSQLTCVAANSFYATHWQLSTPYHVRLIQAFVWHSYGVDIPSVQAIKDRGCGRTEDGKYQFRGD